MTREQSDITVPDEAVVWFTRLNSGDATQEECRQFEAWHARSPLHAQEYSRISALWNDFDGLKEWADNELGQEQIEEQEVSASYSYSPSNREKMNGRSRWGRSRTASLLAVLFVMLNISIWLPDTLMRFSNDYQTGTAEQKSITLADGSLVTMDAETALSVDYSMDQRKLILHQGRAYFTVASDKQRPFVIDTQGGKIQALGTEFEVYQTPQGVAVTVFESRVQVTLGDQVEVLIPGQQLHYSIAKGLSKPKIVDLIEAKAWQRGKLVFTDRPLGEVIEEINRYRQGVVVIIDESLRDFPVSGVFDLNKPDAILQALAEVLPARQYSLTPYLILLDRT